MKYWKIIADNLSKAGWSWGCVSTVDSNGRTTFVADAHRDGRIHFCRPAIKNDSGAIWAQRWHTAARVTNLQTAIVTAI
jgi:hypothetical protein